MVSNVIFADVIRLVSFIGPDSYRDFVVIKALLVLTNSQLAISY